MFLVMKIIPFTPTFCAFCYFEDSLFFLYHNHHICQEDHHTCIGITEITKIKALVAPGFEVMEGDSIKTANDLRIQWFPVSHCFISFASPYISWSSSLSFQ